MNEPKPYMRSSHARMQILARIGLRKIATPREMADAGFYYLGDSN